MGAVEAKIPNVLGELSRVHDLVSKFAAAEKLSPEVVFDLNVVLDELLSNVIKYGHVEGAGNDIEVRLAVVDGVLEIRLEDDGKPFDPLSLPPPDLNRAFSEREPGGLGVHFVRNLMHEAEYARVAGRNRLILRKFLDR
jgi:serine/threonine-protein kinase RsbW